MGLSRLDGVVDESSLDNTSFDAESGDVVLRLAEIRSTAVAKPARAVVTSPVETSTVGTWKFTCRKH
jgi:hypothetical protein